MTGKKKYSELELGKKTDASFITGSSPAVTIQDVLQMEESEGCYLVWTWESETGHVQFCAHQFSELSALYSNLAEAIAEAAKTMIMGYSGTLIKDAQLTAPGVDARWFRIRCMKADLDESQPVRIIGTARDITAQKSAELEMENKLFFIDTLMDFLACPVFFKDEKLVYRHCNRAFETYLGLTRDTILGKTVYDISPPELADVYQEADIKLLEKRDPQIYQARVKTAAGKMMDAVFHKAVVFNPQDEPKGIVGIIYDISDRVEAEERLSRIMGVKDAIVEISHSVMSVETIDQLYGLVLNHIVSAIPAADSGCFLMFTAMDFLSVVAGNGIFAEYPEAIIVPKKDCLACHAMKGDPSHCYTVNSVKDYARDNDFELHGVLDSGEIKSMIFAPITSKGVLSGYLAVGSKNDFAFDDTDLSVMEYVRTQLIQVLDKQNLYEKNIYLAKHDGLTGLLNRKYFEELFEASKVHAQLYNENFHVILIDLDRFKSINDIYGHHVGDAVLMDFAHKLKQCFRESDIIARFGGDEFILLINNTSTVDLENRLETLRTNMTGTPVEASGSKLSYRFSYGLSEFPLEGLNLDRLLRLADYNLYVYKRFKDDDHAPGFTPMSS